MDSQGYEAGDPLHRGIVDMDGTGPGASSPEVNNELFGLVHIYQRTVP